MEDYLRSHPDRVWAASVAFAATLVAALFAAARARRTGHSALTWGARVCGCGFAVAAVLATSLSDLRPSQGFIWRIGRDSLMSWTNDLAQFPHTQPSALLVGNVAVYVPVGFFVALGWFRRAGLALLVALAVPFAAEWAQARFLSGDGSTDDFLLNALGLTVGWTLGMAVGLVIRRTRDRPETNQQRGGS